MWSIPIKKQLHKNMNINVQWTRFPNLKPVQTAGDVEYLDYFSAKE